MIRVYTSGTFDLLHVGHLNFLKRARALGDYLIVGVSTDELANSYRKDKIMMPFEQRIEMVRACKYVDEVVKQTDLAELQQMQEINPDIYVIGDDWKTKTLGGVEWLKKQPGKQVIYLSRTPDISSTKLRQEIADKSTTKKISEDLKELEEEALTLGASKTIPIKTTDIIFDDKAILQCFNCKNFNVKHTCPGKIPKIDYRKLILSYEHALIVMVEMTYNNEEEYKVIRTDSTNKLHRLLLKLEEPAFKMGYHFKLSFIGGSCKLCPDCPPDKCRLPNLSRIPMEGAEIDVMKTLKQFNYELTFPLNGRLTRVGMLLVS